jgi:hypothetical protein
MLKAIHQKYATFGRSGLMYTVELGEQAYDLKLE